ncbi:MAG: AAA family ATPase, partial [Anaerolineae bacterium]
MEALYIASTESFTGKSALCVGLGLRFREDGLSVGYLKPVNTGVRRMRGKRLDEDAVFIREVLGLQESAEALSPVSMDASTITAVLKGDEIDLETRLRDGFDRSAKGKDVVLLEGGGNVVQGALVGLPPKRVAEILGANSLIIARYQEDLSLDGLFAYKERMKDHMLGAVINEVPEKDLARLRDLALPYLEERGIPAFAVLPRERLLQSISVGQLADHLRAKILNSPEKREELVYSLMI